MKKVLALAVASLMVGCGTSRAFEEATIVTGAVESTIPTTSMDYRIKTSVAHADAIADKYTKRNFVLWPQPPPPIGEGYGDISVDNTALYQYTTDFNWYLYYLFSYTSVLNEYSIERGWVAPERFPICQFVPLDDLDNMPRFEPNVDPSKDLRGFEMELVAYIKKLRSLYKEEASDVTTHKKMQRLLCVY